MHLQWHLKGDTHLHSIYRLLCSVVHMLMKGPWKWKFIEGIRLLSNFLIWSWGVECRLNIEGTHSFSVIERRLTSVIPMFCTAAVLFTMIYHMPLAWPAIGLPSCVRNHHLIQLLCSQSIGFLDMFISIRSWYLLTQNKKYWKHPKSLFRYSYDGIVSIAAVETTVPPTNVQSI